MLASGGNANSKSGYEGSENEWENVRRDAQIKLNKVIELWDQGVPVIGRVDMRACWVDFKG